MKSPIPFRRYARGLINRAPYVRTMVEKLQFYERFCPLDHFYSPIANIADLKRREDVIFGAPPPNLPDINLNVEQQLALLESFARFHDEIPFSETPGPKTRYYFQNDFYGAADAVFLYCFLRHFRPKRIIELGSGLSSSLILDVAEMFLDGRIDCTFVDPDPQRLIARARENDLKKCRLIPKRVEEVDRGLFTSLASGDILFIDSSHVVKAGSEVNYLFFEVLPVLPPGVHIHIHDIFYPFEYPKKWIYDGRSWNEAYLVRAFLQNNDRYSVTCFASYLEQFAPGHLQRLLPRCLSSPGQSLWIRKNT
jgi:predicted O-methyltransferase YrrM